MATKKSSASNENTQSDSSESPESAQRANESVKDSAEQIWQAGLGAFAKAQQEGGKIFESLVQDGMALQKQVQAAAQVQLKEAGQRLGGIANDMSQRASEPLGKLEHIFEERVAKALERLGVPTARDIQQLQAQIDALTEALEKAQGIKSTGASKAGSAPADKKAS